jgi:hypothetical protein
MEGVARRYAQIYRELLDDKTAGALAEAIASTRKGRGKKLSDLRDPWVS